MIRRALRSIVTVALSAIVVAGVAWGALAVWFDGPDSRALAGAIVGGLVRPAGGRLGLNHDNLLTAVAAPDNAGSLMRKIMMLPPCR